MDRPGLCKRYTAPSPSHLTLNSLNPLASLKISPLPHLHPLSHSPSSPRRRVLRKSSQSDLTMAPSVPATASTSSTSNSSSSKKSNHRVIPPPHSSFLSLDKPCITRQHSSPPHTAGLTSFTVDKTRTRKQSFIPSRVSLSPSTNRWDLMPSIQGVMSNPITPSSTPVSPYFHDHRTSGINFGSKDEKNYAKKVKDKDKDKDKKDTFKIPIMSPQPPRRARSGPSIHTMEFSTPVSFQHVSSATSGFGANMILSSVPVPVPASRQEQHQEQPYHSPIPLHSPVRSISPNDAVHSVAAHPQSGTIGKDPDLDGWHVIQPAPSPSPRRQTHVTPPIRSSSFQHHHKPYPDHTPELPSDSTDLKAVEVLEHLSGQVRLGGWSDHIVAKAMADEGVALSRDQQQIKRETGSMRSWRDIKKKKEDVRPLSEQAIPAKVNPHGDSSNQSPIIGIQRGMGITRHDSSSSEKTVESKNGVLGGVPVVPPRRTSKLPFPSQPGETGLTDQMRKASKNRRSPFIVDEITLTSLLPAQLANTAPVPPPPHTTGQHTRIPSPTTLPLHLRPLPPIPSESNTPPKSLLPTRLGARLLRPKKASTGPLSASTNRSESPSGQIPEVTSPKVYPKLIARDEPPAALGKRSSGLADRRNGMTAMSFLALDDLTKTASESSSSSSDPLTSRPHVRVVLNQHQTHARKSSAGQRSMTSLTRSESPVVRHIIPPAELSKIGAENHLQRIDSTSSFGSDWRTDVSRYGGGSSIDLGIGSKTSLVPAKPPKTMMLEEDLIGLPPPSLEKRRRGPVVPPRRATNRSGLASSTGPGISNPISPPRTRYAKLSAPPIIQSAASPISSDLPHQAKSELDEFEPARKEFGMCQLDSGRSAWTLPTNDRPSTMGHWSPPDTPSPTKRYFDIYESDQRYPREQTNNRSNSVAERADALIEDDFDVNGFTPIRPTRYARAGISIPNKAVNMEDLEDPTTPKSLNWAHAAGDHETSNVHLSSEKPERSGSKVHPAGPKSQRPSTDIDSLIDVGQRTSVIDDTELGEETQPYMPTRDRHPHPFLHSSPCPGRTVSRV